ncbi:hypothetical protein MAUB1S_01140 [Mycolicibacterium aubagnense]
MGPTRKRDLAIGAVLATIAAYLLVTLVYRWFPPITVWTGLSLLGFAAAEAGWAFYLRAKIRDGAVGVGAGRIIRWPSPGRWWWPRHRPGSVPWPSVGGSACSAT